MARAELMWCSTFSRHKRHLTAHEQVWRNFRLFGFGGQTLCGQSPNIEWSHIDAELPTPTKKYQKQMAALPECLVCVRLAQGVKA